MTDFLRTFTLAALLAASAIALGACAAHNAAEDDPDSFEAVKDIHGGPFTDMMLVYLKTGPNTALTKEQSTEVFKGHMSNMHRLADAGVLLIAGPFSQPRDKTWRGIFLLDTSSTDLAALQTGTDPGVRTGVFTPQFRPIKASIALRSTGELEEAMAAKNAAAKDGAKDTTKPPPSIRGYVMVTADDTASAAGALAKAGLSDKVVWCAKFSGRGDKGAVLVLDAAKVEDVQAALEKAGATGGLSLDGWMSTASLMGLEPAARKLP